MEPVAKLYERLRNSQRRHLADLSALTDGHRLALLRLLDEASAAVLPAMAAAAAETPQVAKATPSIPAADTSRAVSAAAAMRASPMRVKSGDKRRHNKPEPEPAAKRTRAAASGKVTGAKTTAESKEDGATVETQAKSTAEVEPLQALPAPAPVAAAAPAPGPAVAAPPATAPGRHTRKAQSPDAEATASAAGPSAAADVPAAVAKAPVAMLQARVTRGAARQPHKPAAAPPRPRRQQKQQKQGKGSEEQQQQQQQAEVQDVYEQAGPVPSEQAEATQQYLQPGRTSEAPPGKRSTDAKVAAGIPYAAVSKADSEALEAVQQQGSEPEATEEAEVKQARKPVGRVRKPLVPVALAASTAGTRRTRARAAAKAPEVAATAPAALVPASPQQPLHLVRSPAPFSVRVQAGVALAASPAVARRVTGTPAAPSSGRQAAAAASTIAGGPSAVAPPSTKTKAWLAPRSPAASPTMRSPAAKLLRLTPPSLAAHRKSSLPQASLRSPLSKSPLAEPAATAATGAVEDRRPAVGAALVPADSLEALQPPACTAATPARHKQATSPLSATPGADDSPAVMATGMPAASPGAQQRSSVQHAVLAVSPMASPAPVAGIPGCGARMVGSSDVAAGAAATEAQEQEVVAAIAPQVPDATCDDVDAGASASASADSKCVSALAAASGLELAAASSPLKSQVEAGASARRSSARSPLVAAARRSATPAKSPQRQWRGSSPQPSPARSSFGGFAPSRVAVTTTAADRVPVLAGLQAQGSMSVVDSPVFALPQGSLRQEPPSPSPLRLQQQQQCPAAAGGVEGDDEGMDLSCSVPGSPMDVAAVSPVLVPRSPAARDLSFGDGLQPLPSLLSAEEEQQQEQAGEQRPEEEVVMQQQQYGKQAEQAEAVELQDEGTGQAEEEKHDEKVGQVSGEQQDEQAGQGEGEEQEDEQAERSSEEQQEVQEAEQLEQGEQAGEDSVLHCAEPATAQPPVRPATAAADEEQQGAATVRAATDLAAGAAKAAPGSNLVAAVRSFLPAKRALSPQIAAGKKQIKVRALEAAQASKRAEEAKAADKARAKEELISSRQQPQQHAKQADAEEGPHQGAGLFSPAPTRTAAVGVGTGAAGLVRTKAAAFQQRIQQGEETRLKAEEAKRKQDRDAEAQARLACAHGAQPSLPHAAPAAVSKPKRPEGAAQLQPAGGHVLQMAAAAVTQQPARPDVNDKLKRAEQRRKEEEERRRAELEARQKVKEDRTKAARQAAASAVASKAEASRLEPGTRPGAGAGGAAGAGPAGGEAGAAGAAGRGAGAGMQTAGGKAGGPLQARNMNIPTLAAGAGGTGAASKKEAGATAIAPGLTKGPAATAAPTAAATSAATAGVVATASACTTTPGAVRRAQDGEVQFKTVVKVLAQPQPPPATPAELAQEQRNLHAIMTSPYVNAAGHRTPGVRVGATNQVLSYEISPYRSDSDEDEDELAADTARKPIPDWAQPAAVLAQLEKQRMMDADKLFGVQMKTINLEEVFKGMPAPPPADPFKASKRRDWRKRGSSGDWVKDRLLWQEEVAYKRALGLK